MRTKERLPRKAKKVAKVFRDLILIGETNALVNPTSLIDIHYCFRDYAHMYRCFIKNNMIIKYISTCKSLNNKHVYKYIFSNTPHCRIEIGGVDMFYSGVDMFYSGGEKNNQPLPLKDFIKICIEERDTY